MFPGATQHITLCHIVVSLSRFQRNILTLSVIQNYPAIKTLKVYLALCLQFPMYFWV